MFYFLQCEKLTVTTEAFIRFIVNSIVKSVIFELVSDRLQSLNGVDGAYAFLCSLLGEINKRENLK